MKNKYMKTASGVYINYFLLGMVNIMLASNMSYLTEQWDTDYAGVSYIIAAIGEGWGNYLQMPLREICQIKSGENH